MCVGGNNGSLCVCVKLCMFGIYFVDSMRTDKSYIHPIYNNRELYSNDPAACDNNVGCRMV